jgi:quercetin dioxygenase-like cupin family protein
MPILRFSEARVDAGDPGVAARRMVNSAMGSRTITCGVSVFEPGSAIFLHTHPCEEVVAVVDGEAVCELDGERHLLRPFDLSFVPPLVPHRFVNESDRPFTMIYFYPTTDLSRDAVDPAEAPTEQTPHY